MGALLFVGLLLLAAGHIWITIVAAERSVGWALAVLFVPGVGVFYAVKNWEDTGKPLCLVAIGVVLVMASWISTWGES